MKTQNLASFYRITNDGGAYIASRPWHVESNLSGNGWGRLAVCETRANAERFITSQLEPHYPEDALGLGYFNN